MDELGNKVKDIILFVESIINDSIQGVKRKSYELREIPFVSYYGGKRDLFLRYERIDG